MKKTYTPEFKAQVVREILNEQKTMAEIASEYGIGARILDTLMEYLKHHAPEKAFVGLFAAEGSVPFYERYGFKDYSPSMTGIFRVTPI